VTLSDGVLTLNNKHTQNLTFSIMAETEGGKQEWLNFLYIYDYVAPEIRNLPPFLYGIPAIIQVLVELKPANKIFEWKSMEAIDKDDDPITYEFSGNILLKPWFKVAQTGDSFEIKIDKSLTTKKDEGSKILLFKVLDGQSEPNNFEL
jgi:hypothetical protein